MSSEAGVPGKPHIAPELSGLPHVPVDALEPLQGELKTLSKREYNKLKKSLLEHGIIVPFFVWQESGKLLDGHQRQRVMINEGWLIDVPVVYISATDEQDAKRKLLVISSQYGRVSQEGWDAFTFDLDDGWLQDTVHFDALPFVFGEWGDEDEPAAVEVEKIERDYPIFSKEQIIDAAFDWFRANGFPYRNLAPHVSMQEINRLAQTEPDKLLNTTTAYHVADTYHRHRFHAAAEGMNSPHTAFEDDTLLRRALNLQIEHNGTIPQEYFGKLDIVSGTQAAANFRPGFACYLYRQYCRPGDTVLDTSTGYGGRLVGYIASGIGGLYIGIDPNTVTHAANLRMADELGYSSLVELHNLPAEDVPHDALAGRCDFAFTSPPYFRKEHYSDEDTQSWKRYPGAEAWRNGFLCPMMALQYAALKPGSYAIVNIADVKIKSKVYPLVNWTIEAGQAAGFEYVRCDEFALSRRFGAGMDEEVATEPVLVFRKP